MHAFAILLAGLHMCGAPTVVPEPSPNVDNDAEVHCAAMDLLQHGRALQPRVPLKSVWRFVSDYLHDRARANYRSESAVRAQWPPEYKLLMPKLLFVGQGHAGTTSLADQMNMHPSLSYGSCKEHFFWATPWPPINKRSFDAYAHEFMVDPATEVTFDATMASMYLGLTEPNPDDFFMTPGPGAIAKLRELLGADLRIMMMFRDPVDRLKSAGLTTLAQMVHTHWFACGADSVEAWLKFFPRNQFLFLDYNDNVRDPQATLDRIFNFTNTPPRTYQPFELKHTSGRRRTRWQLSLSTRKIYASLPVNQDCKRRLERMVGMKFDWQFW
mmetsp:Transcript_113940/g.317284  ORF Transcript_113940/g.317284 Transcript_113940/m.317284 type:complete len:327 (+) Transcript_113940:114-1094(+)